MAMPRVQAGMASDADALVQDLDGRVGDKPKLLVTGMASLQGGARSYTASNITLMYSPSFIRFFNRNPVRSANTSADRPTRNRV